MVCFQKGQTKFAFDVGIGTGLSTGAWVGKSEDQAFVSLTYKRFRGEADYNIQPFSHFGFKTKTIVFLGYNSDLNRKLVFNVMLGTCRYSATKYTSFENGDNLNRIYYPQKAALMIKTGLSYKINKRGNLGIGINFFLGDDYYYEMNHDISVSSYSFTSLLNLFYSIRRPKNS